MKNKLISLAFLSVLLQSSEMYCAQEPKPQNWGEWLRAKFFGSESLRSYRERKSLAASRAASSAMIAGSAAYAMHQSPKLLEVVGRYASAFGLSATPAVKVGLGTLVFGYYLHLIAGELTYYAKGGDRAVVIQKIKDSLRLVIADQLLYPTRSSKIHALLKKDEFLQGVEDKDNLLQDACDQLISEINAVKYSAEQLEEDKKIDSYIMTLKAQIFAQPMLQEQIAALEKMQGQQQSIEQMRGYLSLYYRLKNQLEVEKQLTPEEKAAREKWRTEALGKLEQGPTEKKEMSEEQRSEYRKKMAEKRAGKV